MLRYQLETLLICIITLCLLEGVLRLIGGRTSPSTWIITAVVFAISMLDGILSKSLFWAWTDTGFYCLGNQSRDGWPYFALWHKLRTVCIRRTWIFRRPYAQLEFDGAGKEKTVVLRLPLHLLSAADRAETLAILRRRVQSCGAAA